MEIVLVAVVWNKLRLSHHENRTWSLGTGDCNIDGKLEFLRAKAFLEIVFSFMGVDLPFFTAADFKSNSVMEFLGILPLEISACDRGMNG